MEPLTLALSPNLLATAGSNLADEAGRITGGPDAGLDFAALLAAGMTCGGESPTGSLPSELGAQTALATEEKSAARSPESESSLLLDVSASTAPPLVPIAPPVPPQEPARAAAADRSAEAHPGAISAANAAGVAAGAAGIAASGKSHPAEAASERAAVAIQFGAKEAPGDPVLPDAPWRSENALHLQDNGVHELAGSAREGDVGAAPVHASASHGMPVASTDLRSPAMPTAVREVAAPVQSSGFADAFSRQIVWMADKDAQIAELRINPPELGPVEVRLTISGDEASAQFVSPHAEVRAAIESSLVRLRESLADAGIALGEAFVSAESFRDDAEKAGSEQRASGYGESVRERDHAAQARSPSAVRRGLVDIFA